MKVIPCFPSVPFPFSLILKSEHSWPSFSYCRHVPSNSCMCSLQQSHPVVQPSHTEVIGRLTLGMVVSPFNQISLPKILVIPTHSFHPHGSLCQSDLAMCIGPGISQWLDNSVAALVFLILMHFILLNSSYWLFWPHGNMNWSFWINWRHKRKCFI